MCKVFRLVLLGLVMILMMSCQTSAEDEMDKLIIGVMPAVDAAPFFVADEHGYFEQFNLNVEIVVFTNANDRQSALQAGAIDGAMSDMIALLTNVQGGFDIKGTTMTDGMFPVLVRKGFEEKERIQVAMMEVSVSNYLADQWLSDRYDVQKIFINEIPVRMEAIKAGHVDMGIFPEPVATMGTLDGLTKRIYPMQDGYCPDILVFTGHALETKTEAIEKFHRALDLAIMDIKEDDSIARRILIERLGLNEAIKSKIDLPIYHLTRLPDDEYVQHIADWIRSVLNKPMDIHPDQVFERAFTHP